MAAGFTVVEMLVVIAIAALLAVIFLPNFMIMLTRTRIEGTVKNAAGIVQQARAQAVRRGVPVIVAAEPNTTNDAPSYLKAWADEDYWGDPSTLHFDPTEEPIIQLPLTWTGNAGSTIHFWAAKQADPATGEFIKNFTDNTDAATNSTYPRLIVFEPEGTLRDAGQLRFGQGPVGSSDTVAEVNHNFLEIDISKAGNIRVKKYVPADDEYQVKSTSSGTVNWTWY